MIPQYFLIFTIVAAPPLDELGVDLPEEATRPLAECKAKLQDAVNGETFVISVSNKVAWLMFL